MRRRRQPPSRLPTLVSPTATIVADQGQTSFQVVISEPVLVSSMVNTAFSINNTAAGTGVGAPAAVDPSGTTPVATTFVVPYAAGLDANDTVRLIAGIVKTADGRSVATTTVTVAVDTIKPVATVLAAPNNSFFQVSFSEPVDNATATNTASYVYVDGQNPAVPLAPGAAAITLDPTGKVATVPTSRSLLPGDRVGIQNNVIEDLATPPNTAAGVTRTVVADNIARL